MKKKLVVLTGAGMSEESGIPTFRGAGGMWEGHSVEEVASPEGFAANPALVLKFYNERRNHLYTCSPNDGHRGLVALEKDFDVEIITQNVDNLHERAGSTNVLHLHGELTKSCAKDDLSTTYDVPPGKELHLGDTDSRGVQLRPFIVWFGEAVPMMEYAIPKVEAADVFAVIGTSLNVYPAAGLLNYARRGVPIFLIDPNEVNAYRTNLVFIKSKASEGVRKLTQLLQEYL
jgi:NAD-dependent deacetylase